MTSLAAKISPLARSEQFLAVRARTLSLCAPLSPEDAQLQSMPDASPAKWHLAHTTWFFEQFVLCGEALDPRFRFLWNSYYDAVGPRVDRARRGLMSRPSLAEVIAYRAEIDRRVALAIDAGTIEPAMVELGIQHEQQHQELILTDIKHALAMQPLQPPYRLDLARPAPDGVVPSRWHEVAGGLVEIGATDGFSFDIERPRHRVHVEPFAIATRPICNAEVLAFIVDGGYTNPALWLSDGFAAARAGHWTAPLYWECVDDVWIQYDLAGVREVDPAETACHVSFYEADAIARWSGARLPTEAEWEVVASTLRADGHFADDDHLHPRAAGDGLAQVYGDVWEWTASAFAPYPGFRAAPGAIGEYNAKFASGQMVLRGGSCLTPAGHVRASYRNFFPPSARWQMAGVRLARDRMA